LGVLGRQSSSISRSHRASIQSGSEFEIGHGRPMPDSGYRVARSRTRGVPRRPPLCVREKKTEPWETLSISSPFALSFFSDEPHHRELRHGRAHSPPHHHLPNSANSSALSSSTSSHSSCIKSSLGKAAFRRYRRGRLAGAPPCAGSLWPTSLAPPSPSS
jgi:hypothetical protein